MSLRIFVTTLEWVDKKQGDSVPVASKNSKKKLRSDGRQREQQQFGNSIYLANLNPPYKNVLFLSRVLNILTVRSKLALQDEIHLP